MLRGSFTLRLFVLAGFLGLTAPAAEPDRIEYLLGEVRTTSPAGQPRASHVYLVRRAIRPEAGRIEIRTTHLAADGHAGTHVAIMEVESDGLRFALFDPEGTYRGRGEGTGVPWRWTSWRYRIEWTGGGGGLSGEDTLTPARLTMTKRYFDGGGQPTQTVSGDLVPITEKAYEILKAKIAP